MADEITLTSTKNQITLDSPAHEITLSSPVAGTSNFINLSDTPLNYTSQALKLVRVKSGEDGLEFIDPETIEDINWGEITGSISAQTDLNLQSVTDNGATTTNSITVGGLNINNAFQFPTTDGTNSQVLKTDGTGTLTWQDESGGGASAINDLTDVTITTPADNELLAYDNASGEWINQTQAEAGLVTTSTNVESFATSLTSGSIPFSNGSNLTQDNTNLFWDDTNNRLGVGTASPSEKLDVDGNINIPTTSSSVGSVTQNGSRLLHTYGSNNFFAGENAGNYSMTGSFNTAIGANSLDALTSGQLNVGLGRATLSALTSGLANMAIGHAAMFHHTTHSGNVAIGDSALFGTAAVGNNNVAIGKGAGRDPASGSGHTNNTFLGYRAQYQGVGGLTNAIAIGSEAQATASNQVVLGNSSVTETLLRGNVGINETTPQNKLDISGGQVIGSSYAGVETAPTNGLLVEGNVGIGTASPSSKVSIEAGTGLTGTTIKKTAGGEDYFQIIDSVGTKQLYIDSTEQLAFNVGASGPVYFGNFSNSTGLAGFSVPGEVVLGLDSKTKTFGVGGGSTYFTNHSPKALFEVRGKSDETQLIVQGNSTQTNNLTEWRDSSETVLSVVDSAGNVGIGTTTPSTALDVNGAITSATTTTSTAGPTDNLDVSGVNTVFINASANGVTIGGFTGGVAGQILHVVVNGIGAGNDATLEHNEGTANQNIFLTTGIDETLTNSYGGWTLVCDGSNWFSSEQ